MSRLGTAPYARPQVLIEKEWIALGHQFKERTMNFYGERPEHDPEQYSPVFLQFIECIWQVQSMPMFRCDVDA